MTTTLRVFGLVLATGAGLAADSTLGRNETATAPLGFGDWALRPTKGPSVVFASPPGARAVPLHDLPEERRIVRVVYEGYREAGPIRLAR